MVRTITSFQITSPQSLKKYTISILADRRLACSCKCFEFKGSCYHTSMHTIPAMVDYYLSKVTATENEAVEPEYVSTKLELLFA